VVSPARLTPQKDPLVVVEAVAALPDVQLIMMGDGPLAAEVAARVDALGVSDRVALPGYVDAAASLLGAADAVVLGSRYEGHVLAGLEAMAASVPFVATSCVGIADWVTNGVDGRLAEVGDAAGLADNLAAVLEDRSLAARLVTAASATVHAHSVEAMLDAHLRAYAAAASR
jgi:glycosyltransferase involved in cell wall biosynthesis